MKKLLAIALITFLATGCAENTSTKEEKTMNQTNDKTINSEASDREKEIRDSTKMLDQQLNDTTK